MEKKGSKKAISELIAYVLLISMSLMLAGAVYSWLKYYVKQPMAEEECPDGLDLILQSYSCEGGVINITVKNKGRFNISGYITKMNNKERTAEDFPGKYPLCTKEIIEEAGYYGGCAKITGGNNVEFTIPLLPNELYSTLFNYTEYTQIRQVEIEPVRGGKACKNKIITQALDCPA